jgi:ribosomal-protein-alanine N-acetyltransferase
MLKHLAVRELLPADVAAVRRLLEKSEFNYVRVTPDELPRTLAAYPAVGAFTAPSGSLGRVTGGTLQAFLLVNALVPPSAWIGGFGTTWSEGPRFGEYLDLLLPALADALAARGGRVLYYSGSDLGTDWLRGSLEALGFKLVTTLRSYDKYDFAVPAPGNQQVRVRPYTAADVAGVLAVESLAFAPLWRYDAAGFAEVAATYPYFVVAEDEQGIAGYQFNAVDHGQGYLVRIAVHPRAEGQGIGTRLMAEAVRYFAGHRVRKILLNTEESNHRAHRLYERFGFYLAQPRGFVLGRAIPIA